MKLNHSKKPRKVLVVDDDAIIRDMMIDILDFEGYTVCTARHGFEALEILRGDEDYLVFLDLMMPVMNGQGVCTVLKDEPELRERHVIVLMSAMDTLADFPTIIDDVDTTMPKPFSVDDVLGALEPYIGSSTP